MINENAKLSSKLFQPDIEQKTTRDGFGDGLVQAAKEDMNIVGLCADLTNSTGMGAFQKEFPDRFVEMGIAEQNMMSVAAGMAMVGKIPFLSTYAVFCPGRNWDQMRVNVCYAKANVKMSGAHSGVSVGPDGGTHQGLEDIALTRCVPNLVVIAPCDYFETKKATLAAARYVGPVYLRYEREKTPVFTTEETPFEIGKAIIMRNPSASSGRADVAIIGCGPLLYNALQAAEELFKEGIGVMVIDNHTIKPMDNATIIEVAKICGAVVTVEDHQIAGGMGSAVAEVLAQNCPVPIEFIGAKDKFGESGTPDELIKAFGMDKDSIKEAARRVIARKH